MDAADDDFAARRGHFLDQKTIDFPGRVGRQHGVNGIAHRIGTLQSDGDAAGIAFVQQVRRHDLDRDRRSQGGERPRRVVRPGSDLRPRHTHAVLRQKLLAGGLVKRRATGSAGGRDNPIAGHFSNWSARCA